MSSAVKSIGESVESPIQNLKIHKLEPPSIQLVSLQPSTHTISAERPPSRSPPPKKRLIPLPSQTQSCVQLSTPIYVALQIHSSTQDGYLSFDEGDEMELIEEFNFNELRVTHLRSGLSGLVLKDFVQLDINTPLRLALNDRGITNRCIMQYNVLGAYLIRRSRHNVRDFVLSIYQINEERNTSQWHYLIRIEPSNKCFYFPDEHKLNIIYFSSFHQLVADERVRAVIPLTEILPNTIEFEEELWNIPFNELSIEEKIGEGEFGEVFRAQWRKDQTMRQVAVKKIRIHGVTDTVTREIEAMKTLTNLYIVSLYGVANNQNSNEMFLVTEFMENGDLKSWLTKLPNLPDYSTLLHFARHITYGMAYLEQRNYVHRDLACRNILVGPGGNIVKIADFGLSTIVNDRDAERRQEAHSQKLAVRWSAPEVLDDKATYSIKSDVWSFGILLIEIWLKGGNPYEKEHPAYIAPAVMNGFVHERPADCPNDFYQFIICRCLKFNPNDRTSFDALTQLLDQWKFPPTSPQTVELDS
jgi:tRNA A-37 threonylcarbamoyl transferase component Bud32